MENSDSFNSNRVRSRDREFGIVFLIAGAGTLLTLLLLTPLDRTAAVGLLVVAVYLPASTFDGVATPSLRRNYLDGALYLSH